jgi:hypothetical protein
VFADIVADADGMNADLMGRAIADDSLAAVAQLCLAE